MVYKDIGLVFTGDESVPFLIVEPLYFPDETHVATAFDTAPSSLLLWGGLLPCPLGVSGPAPDFQLTKG